MEDIEDVYKRLEAKYDKVFNTERGEAYKKPTPDDLDRHKGMILHILSLDEAGRKKFDIIAYKRKMSVNVKNSFLFGVYLGLVARGDFKGGIEEQVQVSDVLKIKKGKSSSGVLVITLFTSPYPSFLDVASGKRVQQTFSCKHDCHYCPNEKGVMPRSYLSLEPGCQRAKRAGFDCVEQMWERMNNLYMCGHVHLDKLEVLVLGGTWSNYPVGYQREFCRDIYYAANVFWDANRRERMSLEDEKKMNKNAMVKVIGLTLETRPDCVNEEELIRFREYGVTRVQLGIQHTDSAILKRVNRGCGREDAVKALKLLKESCWKVDTHFMPNLPGSSPELDEKMLVDELLGAEGPPKRWTEKGTGWEWEEWTLRSPELQSDQWKIYPAMVVPYSKMAEWYQNGEYIPYGLSELQDVLLKTLAVMFPWIRINRLIRDISGDYLLDHVSKEVGDMRNSLEAMLKEEGKSCACIRCRQITGDQLSGDYTMRMRKYNASDGVEFFIAAESKDAKKLYGFVRLRFPQNKTTTSSPFPEIVGLALIRELHVYGLVNKVGEKRSSNAQHRGIGKHLMHVAEVIAKRDSWRGLAVISGEGVRGYYERLGFVHDTHGLGQMMIKIF